MVFPSYWQKQINFFFFFWRRSALKQTSIIPKVLGKICSSQLKVTKYMRTHFKTFASSQDRVTGTYFISIKENKVWKGLPYQDLGLIIKL